MSALPARVPSTILAATAAAALLCACTEQRAVVRSIPTPESLRVRQRIFATEDAMLVLRASAWTLFDLGFVSMKADIDAGVLHAKSPTALGHELVAAVQVDRTAGGSVLVTLALDDTAADRADAVALYDSFFAPLGRNLRLADQCPAPPSPIEDPAGLRAWPLRPPASPAPR